MLQPGVNCWRIEQANRAALIVDAADYFRHALDAMLKARSQIFLIGWDLDTRIRLADASPEPGVPVAVGPLFSWLVKRRPDLKIHVLAWDEGLVSVPGRGTTLLRLLRWHFDGVTLKWDGSHPLDASHHQKTLIIDDSLAFCGGIDITAERWDTRDHRDGEPGRKRPFTGRFYGPWHDAIMAVDGAAARALGDLARKRWKIATGETLPETAAGGNPWPRKLRPQFADVPVAIARTRGHEGDVSEVREIEKLYLDLIAAARRNVYIESQYFASRVIAEAIAKRLEEQDGPEFVVVNPRTGSDWLDDTVMSAARYHLLAAVRARDPRGRLGIYSPVTERSQDIYVHAKIMIVDDLFIRAGSANLNNRSMGLDSECDLLIDARERKAAQAAIAGIRAELLAEHLGVTPAAFAGAFREFGSLIGAIEALRGTGRTLWPLEPARPGRLRSNISVSEVLDPEAPDELFEPRARPGLLSRFARAGRRVAAQRRS
jgi:phospholipase D1/2